MSPRRKGRMKYWGFYCPDDLKADTIQCAEAADESDSEYIRKAVEMRNKKKDKLISTTPEKEDKKAVEEFKTFFKNK